MNLQRTSKFVAVQQCVKKGSTEKRDPKEDCAVLLREYCTTFVLKSATYGTDNNDPITENKRLDKDNYVDAKSLKMSFKPARLFAPFACSGRHGTFSFKSCVVLFHTLFKHFNKRTLPVWSRTFSPLFFSGGSDSWRETFTLLICEASLTLGSEVKVVTHLIAVLDGSMSHHRHLNKDVEIGEVLL